LVGFGITTHTPPSTVEGRDTGRAHFQINIRYRIKKEFGFMNVMEILEKEQMRGDIPDFKTGDTIKVFVRIVEGQKQRIQAFEGVVIRRRRGDVRSNFTVRKISYGVGVERTFPLHSPVIDRIEVVTRGKVRRSRLYYLRSLRGKQARIKEARVREVGK
jgi:large subunit ribosomal protein L19